MFYSIYTAVTKNVVLTAAATASRCLVENTNVTQPTARRLAHEILVCVCLECDN